MRVFGLVEDARCHHRLPVRRAFLLHLRHRLRLVFVDSAALLDVPRMRHRARARNRLAILIILLLHEVAVNHSAEVALGR